MRLDKGRIRPGISLNSLTQCYLIAFFEQICERHWEVVASPHL